MKSEAKYSRRSVLRSAGIGAAMLPLLQQFHPARAAGFPKRLLIVINSNGNSGSASRNGSQFFPTGGSGESLMGMKFGVCSAPLEPYQSDLLFLQGLCVKNDTDSGPMGTDNPAWKGGHYNFPHMFTGMKARDPGALEAAGITIDQFIADEIAKQEKLPIRVLNVRACDFDTTGDNARVITCIPFYRGKNQPVTSQNVTEAYKTVFGAPAGRAPTGGPPNGEKRVVLDFVHKQLTSFSNRLGVEDKQKVDAHVQAVQELEDRISTLSPPSPPSASCSMPPVLPASFKGHETELLPQMDALTDLIVAAFKCDITRVATLQLTNSNGDRTYIPNKLVNPTGYFNSHFLAHLNGPTVTEQQRAASENQKPACDGVLNSKLGDMITKMKAIPEGGGTMLDNTVILWANHMGDGNLHNSVDLPLILAGSCGGYFKTGRILKFPGPRAKPFPSAELYANGQNPTPLNGLYVGLANAMGIPITTFGDPGYGGLLPGLSG